MTTAHVARDVSIAFAALVLLVTASLRASSVVAREDVTTAIALFTSAAGVAAAATAVLVARLTGHARIGWLSAAIAGYSLIAVPATAVGMHGTGTSESVSAVGFLAHCLVAALLVVALVAPRPLAGRQAGAAITAVAVATGAGALLGSAFPAAVRAVTSWPPLGLTVGIAWIGVAAVLAGRAARRRDWAMWQVAGGLGLLGMAPLPHVISWVSPVTDLQPAFSTVGLAAAVLVLVGMARMAQEALVRLELDREHQDEELRLAEVRLQRAADRDHELRTGLAGLAGAANLIRKKVPGADPLVLGTAVAAELNRLDDLLQAPGRSRRGGSNSATYAVAPVLSGLVALRSSSGMDLRLDVEHGLRAVGSSSVLAQVVTNLLGNVERHAPGSSVRITAVGDPEQVVIRVRDFGPGIPPGSEAAVFDRGARDQGSSGCGLGLHICRSLLAADGGTIYIPPSSPDHGGCTVVVRLPRAAPTAAAGRSTASMKAVAS